MTEKKKERSGQRGRHGCGNDFGLYSKRKEGEKKHDQNKRSLDCSVKNQLSAGEGGNRSG